MTDGDRIAAALERIAALLEVLVAGSSEPPPADDAPVGCPHPAESRTDFGVTGGRADWQCQVCGFRTVAQDETYG